MNEVRLTIVVDNQAADGLTAEHGFSLWVETPKQNILFDTGQEHALLTNLAALGVDPRIASAMVLSHGHYDHTGGVENILKMNTNLQIYLHAAVFQPRYSIDDGKAKIVKMPLVAMAALMHYDEFRINWLTKPIVLSEHIGIAGPIPRVVDFEDTGGPFFLDPEGKEADIIKDDTALWLRTAQGLVVCLGCCHSGLINTLQHITAISGENRIATIIGGLHLLRAGKERLIKTVAALEKYDIKKIIACHCTGEAATAFLRENIHAEVVTGHAGLRVSFEAMQE